MKAKLEKEYLTYARKIGDRLSLYKVVANHYRIKSALYGGSHIDIAPSFVIPNVIYIDNFKGSIKFFKNKESILDIINKNKQYKERPRYLFIGQDYYAPINIMPVDLLISQYAGFVSQANKSYLKLGGILLANDSHGDASLANFDKDYKLIGVINNKEVISKNLSKYFKLKNNQEVNLDLVKEKIKGLNYILNAENYIFIKVN